MRVGSQWSLALLRMCHNGITTPCDITPATHITGCASPPASLIPGRDNAEHPASTVMCDQYHRPGLIEGQRLAPEHPRWARLLSVRQAESYLFLRYALAAPGV